MKITVNGDTLVLDDDTTIAGLVAHLGLNRGPVAVERNAEVVPRAQHAETELVQDDVIEIVHFVGGG
jgi:thiamine biosynthesis protein ThiS